MNEILLPARDATILTGVIRFTTIPVEKRLELLSKVESPESIEVGRYILGLDTEARPEIRKLAAILEGDWREVQRIEARFRGICDPIIPAEV